jgi:polyisoprenyl-teichoic acid--peptidoglycan teichoic acid transferase
VSAYDLPGDEPRRTSWGQRRRAVLGLAIVVLFAAATTATAVLLEVAQFTGELGGTSLRGLGASLTLPKPGKPQTVLLIGSDQRYADRKDRHNARSDTIILLRLNAGAHAITLLSIPRDLKVHLKPGAAPDKINAAYSQGGPKMTAKVVKRVLSWPGHPFAINHIVNINFGGFRDVVNTLGCVYADVDRNYFNDNNPPVDSPTDYATINIRPGYQRLCGQNALDYVRFRHLDTDIVRAARQQDFLRQAKAQYGTGKIFANRHRLARIFGRYTQTDAELHKSTGFIKLLDLGINTAGKPIEDVHFPAILGAADDPFVTARPAAIRKAVAQFMAAGGAPKPKPKPKLHRKRRKRGPVPGMVDASSSGQQQGLLLGAKLKMPFYYPKRIPATAHYMTPLGGVYPRAYHLKARGRLYGAYRLTLATPGLGQYVGIQGTTWKDPPALRSPSETRVVAGRRLELFYDGKRLRFAAWRTPTAVYWVSNTLLEQVGERQMLAIAASFTRLGAKG